MIYFLLGLALGIGLCEFIVQRLHYSSIALDAWDAVKRLRNGY